MNFFKTTMLLLCMLPALSHAQNNMQGIDLTAAAVVKQIRASSSEKIFLQTDRQVYFPGETIWSRAFLLDSVSEKISLHSNILFADLVNDNDSVLYSIKLYAAQLQTNGSFLLSDSLPSGYYWLRAYTNAMLQSSNTKMNILPLYISGQQKQVNAHDEITAPAAVSDSLHPLVDIFPEGGSLISGADNTVVLKVHDKNGNPLQVKGIIRDNHNNTVTNFSSASNGLAKFVYSPSWFRKYSVWLQNKTGYDSVTVLPPINFFSGRLSVNSIDGDNIKATVMLEDSLFSPAYTTYVIGISKDSVCFGAVGRGMYEMNIPVNNFPPGVAYLLLFNHKKELLSERDVYISKPKAALNITADKLSYAARENVKLQIQVSDAAGKPAVSSLTLCVTDKRIADASPGIIYNDADADTSDLALLAQNGVLKKYLASLDNNTETTKYGTTNDSTFIVTGKVLNAKKEPVIQTVLSVMTKDKDMNFIQDTTSNTGEFNFTLPFFYDSTKFSVQVNSKNNGKDNIIILNPAQFPLVATPGYLKLQYSTAKASLKQIQRHYDSVLFQNGKGWLPPVKVNTTADKKQNSKARDPGLLTQQMLLEGGFNNVGNAVLRSGKFHLLQGYLIAGGSNAFAPSAQDEPLVIIDGVWVPMSGSDAADEKSPVLGFLKSLDPRNIDYIKLLSGPEAGIYGVRSGHGVIEIHTANKLYNETTGTSLKTIYPQGLYRPRFFPMPDYSNIDIKYSDKADLRTTVYWNGDIVTDAEGKASLQFFTADVPTQYVITIRGVTANGQRLYKTIVIDRK